MQTSWEIFFTCTSFKCRSNILTWPSYDSSLCVACDCYLGYSFGLIFKNNINKKRSRKREKCLIRFCNLIMSARGSNNSKSKVSCSSLNARYQMFVIQRKTHQQQSHTRRDTNLLKTGGEGLDLVLVLFFALVGLSRWLSILGVTRVGWKNEK